MSGNPNNYGDISRLAVVMMLFGLLSLANHGNEFLKQAVISPGSSADLGVAAACRADELEEEQLTLQECQLMVQNVRILLSSSPDWFRPFQQVVSGMGIAAALFCIVMAFSLINSQAPPLKLATASLCLMLVLDVVGFVAAVNTGPMLRAQYLWPLLLWIAIHLCLLVALIRFRQQSASENR